MDRTENIEKLREAAELIEQARELIREAVEGTHAEGAAHAYIIPHLASWIESGYQCGGISDLIERLEDEMNPEEDDEEE